MRKSAAETIRETVAAETISQNCSSAVYFKSNAEVNGHGAGLVGLATNPFLAYL
jgi:hypothetical protein